MRVLFVTKPCQDRIIPFYAKLSLSHSFPFLYKNLCINLLESTNEEKGLSVIVDDSLKFHRHTATAVKKANSVLGVIKKSFTTLDTTTLPLLYESMVIWGPHYKGDEVIVEKVQ